MIRAQDYLRFLLDLLDKSRVNAEVRISELRFSNCKEYLDLSSPLKILDLANGNLRPQFEILRRLGHTVVGIDYVNQPKTTLKGLLYGVARAIFNSTLQLSKSRPRQSALVYGDVQKLPFSSASFDLVTSVAAFEHFLNVNLVVEEMYRILKPGGVAWIAVHHFASLSGGHNVSLRLGPITSMPDGIEPWDHLRKRKLPFHVPLNMLRPRDYLRIFSEKFQILSHYFEGPEGLEILTEELKHELNQFSIEELTNPSFFIVARKPS